ncbi:hypothetical protein [Heyndrickxia oleronia]|jgi:hypothetical protein|uniref:hypothetical protein n=1 Tax=Heyndrickxia oleronia TaxID=38875 RepID=UPI0024329F9E|nr:hypothetical protein [Heyndrickxia oleronia]MCI1593227.1 hypothetical protein [Heyndrickxia oleronia]MCI1615468.1 hypothetical protein [Heyndrickxia oleronia]MCI1746182.1 hypothetical protein [Heyndrickxia oleronia]MCI1763565.1 hypothetical protein [Heyndrickxia oleronia]
MRKYKVFYKGGGVREVTGTIVFFHDNTYQVVNVKDGVYLNASEVQTVIEIKQNEKEGCPPIN